MMFYKDDDKASKEMLPVWKNLFESTKQDAGGRSINVAKFNCKKYVKSKAITD